MKRPFEGKHGLSYFCKNQSSFKAKFGAITLYKAHFPTWLERVLLTFEYLQLFSLTILLHPNIFLLSDANPNNTFIFRVVVYFFQMVNPSYLLSFERSDATTYCVLAIIFANVFFKYLMLSYIIYTTSFNKEPNPIFKTLWRWIVKLQGRAACCFVTSFWVRTIVNTANDSWSIQGLGSRAVISIASVLIASEYIVSFLLETQFGDFIPTNRWLSSKNYDMQVITLIQKLMIQFTQIFVNKNVEASIWICIILNFVLGWVRGYRFFTTLPLYNYDSLLFQGDLIAVLSSLNIVHFLHHILRQADYSQETDFRFILVIWIVIGILSVKLSRAYLRQTYMRLLIQSHQISQGNNPDLLLHKIFATKYLIENSIVSNTNNEKSDISHLLGITQTLNLSKIFNIKPIETSYDSFINNHEDTNTIFLEYLNQLFERFPNNSLIKLNLAYQHFRSSKFHSKIIQITSKLNESLLSPYYLSSTLLLYNLELTTIAEFNTVEEKNKLNLMNFMDQQNLLERIEKEMLKQIALRKQICESIIGETPDLETIYQNSQVLHRSKISIQKKINYFLKQIPSYNLRPLLVFAEYSLYLNYSLEDYHNYYENYSRKMARFAKEFEANSISEENLYDPGNAFLIISTENNSLVCLPKSLEDICGIDRNNYIGTSPTRLFPYGLRNYYAQIFKEIFEKGHTEWTNRGIPTLLAHKEGYFIKADIFIRVHPFMSRNSYLDMIIRPHRTFNDAILLDKAGKIEGVTKDIAEFLGIHIHKTRSRLHIKEISEDLAKLNDDLVKPEDGQGSSTSSENKIIELSKPNLQKQAQETTPSLKCIVLSIDCTTYPLNLIRLQRIPEKSEEVLNYSSSCELTDDSLQEGEQINYIPPSSSLFRNLTTLNDSPEDNSPEHAMTTRANNLETEENLMSPTSSRAFIKSSFANSPKRQQQKYTVTFNTNQFPPTIPKIPTTDKSSPVTPINKSPTRSKITDETSSKASHLNEVFKAFQLAINTKSYQKSFNFLCLIFYGVIFITLVAEAVLKMVLDNTMDHLITKTSLLNYAQRRNVYALMIHNTARGSVLTIGGLLTTADLNLADSTLRGNLANMEMALDAIIQSNEGILNNLSSESDEIKAMLFKTDIAIQGNLVDSTDETTEFITHFQHADMLANVIAYLDNLDLLGSPAGAQAFTFVTHNTVNGFLVKNQEITNVFQDSVDKQKESLQTLINLIVIILPILLAGVVFLVAVIIWKQYTVQKRHLLAFLKLNPGMVQKILENLRTLEKKLIDQEKLYEQKAPHLIYRLERNTEFINYHKGHNLQFIRSGKMQRRYFLYIFRVLFYIALLIAIVIVNYVCISNAINGIYRQQRQLQYANYISSTVSVTYNAFTESFATKNTNYVKGQPPADLFKQGITAVGGIQANIYSEFKLENGGYDPDVKAILFEEVDCNHFVTAGYDNCVSLQNLGLPNKMVSLISLYKNQLENKYAQYLAVDKSSLGVLIATAVSKLGYILAPYRVSASEAQMINVITSEKLIDSVGDLYGLGMVILVIFSMTLAVVSTLIWFQILTKVREVNNDFKKVLAVLPPNIILSSFLLKSFLNKTSNVTQKL